MKSLSLAEKPLTPIDNHTVPSSRFTRPLSNVEASSSPPPPAQNLEGPVFTRAPQLIRRSSNGNGAIETFVRQIHVSTMNGNDPPSSNDQPTIVVKETKVIPSSELIGAVTRAKDGQ